MTVTSYNHDGQVPLQSLSQGLPIVGVHEDHRFLVPDFKKEKVSYS